MGKTVLQLNIICYKIKFPGLGICYILLAKDTVHLSLHLLMSSNMNKLRI